MLELSIRGESINGIMDTTAENTFEIAPSVIYNRKTPFVISVKNNKHLDYENLKKIDFKVLKIFLILKILITYYFPTRRKNSYHKYQYFCRLLPKK